MGDSKELAAETASIEASKESMSAVWAWESGHGDLNDMKTELPPGCPEL
jgi:hypothetical protein